MELEAQMSGNLLLSNNSIIVLIMIVTVILFSIVPQMHEKKFEIFLSQNQYIEEREIPLLGTGLPQSADLQIHVYHLSEGKRVLVPQKGETIRTKDRQWRYQWVNFNDSGKHEIEVQVVRDSKVIYFPAPIPVYVGAYATASKPEEPKQMESVLHIPVISQDIIDLSPWVIIHDQGIEGSSPAFAAITAMETSLARKGKQQQLSARYVYEKAKQHNELGPQSEGTYLNTIVYVVEQFGVVPESIWPYKAGEHSLPVEYNWEKLDKVASETKAQLYRVSSYEEIPLYLSQGRPILAGVSIYSDTWYSVADGWIQAPPRGAQIIGRHAVVIVGFNPSDSSIIVANSWGTGWAISGFARLTKEMALKILLNDMIWAVEIP